ncbi:MAG: hypothetical protein WED33_05105 [Bacteroidia bacterium]
MQEEDKISDLENGFPKGNPFKVPEGYFDRFPSRMLDKIENENSSYQSPFSILLKPVFLLAAASVTIFIGIYILKVDKQDSQLVSADEISRYVYQEGIIDEIDINEIIEYSDATIYDAIEVSENESSEIEKYLLDEDIDINDIINEL